MSNKEFAICDEPCEPHSYAHLLKKIKDALPDDNTLFNLADLFKIFGDSTRIKILYVLFESELCVCEIAELLGMTSSATSHQLRVLRDAGLLKFRRDGKTVYYSLADGHVRSIIEMGFEHITEEKE